MQGGSLSTGAKISFAIGGINILFAIIGTGLGLISIIRLFYALFLGMGMTFGKKWARILMIIGTIGGLIVFAIYWNNLNIYSGYCSMFGDDYTEEYMKTVMVYNIAGAFYNLTSLYLLVFNYEVKSHFK